MGKKYSKENIQSLNENELRKQIVIPLFNSMNYAVYDTHGALEFGKDLVFYNRESTGEVTYSAVQIKIKDIQGTSASSQGIRTIINQCESAFEIPFIDAFDGTQKHIEKVFIVTSGKITTSAANIINHSLRKYGGIRFWDITRLVEQSQKILAPTKPQDSSLSNKLSSSISSVTRRVSTGCGELYVTVGDKLELNPIIFASLEKAGGCSASYLEALSSVIGLALAHGTPVEEIVSKLRGIRCPSIAWESGKAVLSCADAIAGVLESYIDGNDVIKRVGFSDY